MVLILDGMLYMLMREEGQSDIPVFLLLFWIVVVAVAIEAEKQRGREGKQRRGEDFYLDEEFSRYLLVVLRGDRVP